MDVGVKGLLLDNGLPDYVELVWLLSRWLECRSATDVLKKFLITMLLQIAIVEVAQVEFDVIVDQVVDTKKWDRDIADVEANIHVDVANDDVDVFVAMHLDVDAICS